MVEHRCRLCTANDLAAVQEKVAEDLWESRRQPEFDLPWAETSDFWQNRFREFAAVAVQTLRS